MITETRRFLSAHCFNPFYCRPRPKGNVKRRFVPVSGFVSESICEEEDKTPNPCRWTALSDAKKFPIMRSKASASAGG